MRVKMILVGGFLGAGKTTLLARAAEQLARRGLRTALVTNDQAANLVDSELLRQAGQEVKEVSGACFCCAFNKLLYVCDNLIAQHHPDVIIGEPVGSCTDLSATVLQPLKKLCADRFDLAAYSVLVDPERLEESLSAGESADIVQAIRYIYRKQIQEADLVVVNKADSLPAGRLDEITAVIGREFPGAAVMSMSALTSQGVGEWLDRVMAGPAGGQRIVEVNYDTYADGEAALGWLNATATLSAVGRPADWHAFATAFMQRAQAKIVQAGGEIAHLKILLTAPGGRVQANLTGNDAPLAVRGTAVASRHATLVVNARVRTSPEQLKEIIESSLRDAAGTAIEASIAEIASFRPGRPMPVHRFGSVA